MSSQVRIHDDMSLINQSDGATATPSALMKIHATMLRETMREMREVNEPTLEPCQRVFETFFLPLKQRSLTDCVNCHDGDQRHVCTC